MCLYSYGATDDTLTKSESKSYNSNIAMDLKFGRNHFLANFISY